jgi:hypothetical protein
MTSFGKTYARLLAASVATAAGLVLLGYFPTLRLAGAGAIGAMVAGIGISLVAGCVGAVPIGLAGRGDSRKLPQAILFATVLRFLVCLALAASALLSGLFEPLKVLGLWVALSYLAMLVVDTMFAAYVVGKARNHS